MPGASNLRDVAVLAKILATYVEHARLGHTPKYLYLPQGGVMRLADALAWMGRQEGSDGFPTLCGMRVMERPDALEPYGIEAHLSVTPLDGH